MPKPKDWRPYLIVLLSLCFLLLAVVAGQEGVSGVERSVFDAVYGMPEWLKPVALAVTQLGSAWALLGLAGLLLAIRRQPNLSLIVLRNGVLAYVLTEVLKRLVGRPRPPILLQVVQREQVLHGLGFPSGHTALATVIGLTLWPYMSPRWRWIVPTGIGLVAWSRVYLGVHAPWDVVGGFLLGVVVALGLNYVQGKGTWKQEKS